MSWLSFLIILWTGWARDTSAGVWIKQKWVFIVLKLWSYSSRNQAKLQRNHSVQLGSRNTAYLVFQKPSHGDKGVFQHKNESTILRISDFTTWATHSFDTHTPFFSVRQYYTTPGQRQFTSAATSRITAAVNTQKCNKTHNRENNEMRCSRGRISAQHKRAFQCNQNALKADKSTMFTHRGSVCASFTQTWKL